ncbi:hypothetical protein IMZ48_46855 [Candidatus Bathyarchaeota archaeon]|nr:hypothetical protein [Candidatus Bathyarchaeota archaeon]
MASPLVVPAAFAADPITIIEDVKNDKGKGYRDIVERPSGTLLATRASDPSVWEVDPNSKVRKLLFEIQGADYIEAITALPNEVYVFWAYIESSSVDSDVPSSSVDPEQPRAKVPGIWKVDLSGADDQKPVPVRDFPEDFDTHVGLAAWGETRVLMCDTNTEVVRIIDITTKTTKQIDVAIAIDTLKLKYADAIYAEDGWVYLIKNNPGELYRIPVDADAHPKGEPERITSAPDLDLSGSFDVADDGAVYAVSNESKQVLKINLDGDHVAIAGGSGDKRFQHPAAVRIGRTLGKTETLYVTTMESKVDTGRIMAIENY